MSKDDLNFITKTMYPNIDEHKVEKMIAFNTKVRFEELNFHIRCRTTQAPEIFKVFGVVVNIEIIHELEGTLSLNVTQPRGKN